MIIIRIITEGKSLVIVTRLLMLYSLYMLYHYIICFIASHRSHNTHFFPSNACRISIHLHVTHAAPHFISAPNLTNFEFYALHGWACALQSNKHSYGSHLCLFLYLHSTGVLHLPGPEKDLQPCIFTRVTFGGHCDFLRKLLEVTIDVRLGPVPHRTSLPVVIIGCQQTELDFSTVVFFIINCSVGPIRGLYRLRVLLVYIVWSGVSLSSSYKLLSR